MKKFLRWLEFSASDQDLRYQIERLNTALRLEKEKTCAMRIALGNILEETDDPNAVQIARNALDKMESQK